MVSMKISPDLMYRFKASRMCWDGLTGLTLRLQALDTDRHGYWINVPDKDALCTRQVTESELASVLDPESEIHYHKIKIAEALAQEIVDSLDW